MVSRGFMSGENTCGEHSPNLPYSYSFGIGLVLLMVDNGDWRFGWL